MRASSFSRANMRYEFDDIAVLSFSGDPTPSPDPDPK